MAEHQALVAGGSDAIAAGDDLAIGAAHAERQLRTNIAPSDAGGSGTSSSRAELATPGNTVIARIASLNQLRKRAAARFPGRHLYAPGREKFRPGRNEIARFRVDGFIPQTEA